MSMLDNPLLQKLRVAGEQKWGATFPQDATEIGNLRIDGPMTAQEAAYMAQPAAPWRPLRLLPPPFNYYGSRLRGRQIVYFHMLVSACLLSTFSV